ncbi:protein RKD3 [Sorghum bicolor]|uniref:protein RKD3 n=1 Tax=Sorghum bicolor TaxID=4558 RepID=UPI000B42541E|nr:protein RKD3 [Sorghum bicolor]|eukprot:XP_021303811.1 protein RKD3 [Sorghum bicolor]
MELSPLPPPRLLRASRIDSGGRSEALRHLDHIGFNDLRTYFYMPFNRAATTMKVRLTVLKQCSHELVDAIMAAHFPCMQSWLRAAACVPEMANHPWKPNDQLVLEHKINELKRYRELIEENPSMELPDRTKKLRKTCNNRLRKTRNNRRRAAGSNHGC